MVAFLALLVIALVVFETSALSGSCKWCNRVFDNKNQLSLNGKIAVIKSSNEAVATCSRFEGAKSKTFCAVLQNSPSDTVYVGILNTNNANYFNAKNGGDYSCWYSSGGENYCYDGPNPTITNNSGINFKAGDLVCARLRKGKISWTKNGSNLGVSIKLPKPNLYYNGAFYGLNAKVKCSTLA